MGLASIFINPAIAAGGKKTESAEENNGKTKEQALLSRNTRLVNLCKIAVLHDTFKDVNYSPGVDVHGKPVKRADIKSPYPQQFPISIPIELDLVERFNLDVPLGIVADPVVAGVRVFDDGSVTYNGHEITSNVQEFCIHEKVVADPAHPENSEVTGDGHGVNAEQMTGDHHAPASHENNHGPYTGDVIKGGGH